MELEKWLEDHDIEKMIMDDLKVYLTGYQYEDEESYNELFQGINLDEVSYKFHSVSYVINKWNMFDGCNRKYISAKIRLEYDGLTFAEYESIYDLEGNGEDDYLRNL